MTSARGLSTNSIALTRETEDMHRPQHKQHRAKSSETCNGQQSENRKQRERARRQCARAEECNTRMSSAGGKGGRAGAAGTGREGSESNAGQESLGTGREVLHPTDGHRGRVQRGRRMVVPGGGGKD